MRAAVGIRFYHHLPQQAIHLDFLVDPIAHNGSLGNASGIRIGSAMERFALLTRGKAFHIYQIQLTGHSLEVPDIGAAGPLLLLSLMSRDQTAQER